VTGVAPFTAASPVSVAYKHVREEPAPPSTIVHDLPGAMDRIVLTALAKDLGARYQSAQDLRGDLLRFERGRPLVGAPMTAVATEIPTRVAATTVVAAPRAVPAPAPVSTTQPARRTHWGPIAAVGIALALLLGLIVFLLMNSDLGGGGSATPTLDVPTVVGLQYGQAQAGLTELGFTVSRTDVDDPTEIADKVLGQDPESGRKIPKGGKITLSVSSATITMPNVVGQTRESAATLVAKASLVPNFVEADSPQPPGTVLSTDPGAGGQVPKNADGSRPTVTVTVAREPLVPVPDVAGQNAFAAAAVLGQASFQVTVVQTPSDTVPVGGVIGTDPPAGTPLARGSAVNLLQSSGPAQVTVPNVVGAARATAETLLNGTLGFGVQVSFANAGPAKRGLVVAQSPAAGQPAPKGSTVSIVVGL
jgi:beta-lactam-binding protein with PASTA domain